MQVYYEDVALGSAIPPLHKDITLVMMMMYGAATWDFLRLHYDHAYARSRGFPQPCIDGQMLGAFAAQQLTNWIGDGGLVTHLEFRNRAFVYPGDRLTCHGTVVEKTLHAGTPTVTCALWIENQDGVRVLDAGQATVTLPLRKEEWLVVSG